MQRRGKKKLQLKILAILTATVSMGGGQAFASENNFSLEEYSLDNIVVTATRTPNEEIKTNANITVLKGEELQKRHYKDLTEVLRDVPGVSIHQYAPAGYEPSNSIYLNGSNNVVVLVDGVRQNYAGGTGASLTSALKSLGGIERIEVLRGSASTLYGSDAKGGVINVITKKASSAKTTLGIGFGSYDKEKYILSTEGSKNMWDWRLKYQKDASGHYSDANGRKTPSKLSAKSFGVRLGNQLNAVNYLALDLRTYEDDNYYRAPWETKIKQGKVDHLAGTIKWNLQVNDKTKNQFTYGRSKYAYDVGYGLTQIWTTKISDQLDTAFENHLLTLGFDFTKDEMKGIKKDIYNRSFYLQDQLNITDALNFTAGIRNDNSSGFGTHNSPSFSLGYDFTPMSHMYIAYSGYFIAPTPRQLYGAYGPNPNLKPETGNTKEVGFAHDFGDGLGLRTSYFKRTSKDRIGWVSLGGYNGQNRNVGDEDAHGWSLNLTKRVDNHLYTHIGYTTTHVGATEAREENVDGYLPKRQLNIGIDYQNRAFSSSLLTRGVFDRKGVQKDPLGAFFPATNYWVVDLALNYNVEEATKVYLKVNNLFNEFYAEASNARTSWGGQEKQWWTAPGRNFMFGVEQSF